jgi:hypothetical protein
MKCKVCKGCLERVYIDNEAYFYCWLCKLVYKLMPGLRLKKLNVDFDEWLEELQNNVS